MNEQVARMLYQKAQVVAERYSQKNRAKNHNHETFKTSWIHILSETTACVEYQKNTDKHAIAFFYYVDMDGGRWFYFFPTDAHILGMSKFYEHKTRIERLNLPVSIGA